MVGRAAAIRRVGDGVVSVGPLLAVLMSLQQGRSGSFHHHVPNAGFRGFARSEPF